MDGGHPVAVQAAARPRGKGVGSAALGVLLTLVVFVIVFVGFLLAPLALLLVAFLVWTVMKARSGGEGGHSAGAEDGGKAAATGFGSGAR